jgi:hypothetical protein
MKKYIPNPILRGVLIAGIVALLIFAVIGLSKITPKAFNSIGSAFSSISSSLFSPKETLVISLSNNSVESEEFIDVSFEHKNKSTAGIYEFKFDCSNKDISMILLDGPNKINMPCTATSTLSSNHFRIVPILKTQNSFIDSYIHISFFDQEKNSIRATGKTVFTVRNTTSKGLTSTSTQIVNIPIITTRSTTSAKIVENQQQANPNIIRKSDLYIISKNAGIVVNNVFIPKTTFSSYETPAIRFNIGNDGNIETGPWYFTAILPTYPSQVFPSGIQPSLKPGEIIEYTLTLQNLAVNGNNIATINVDPTQNIPELSETNNGAVINLVNSGPSYITGLSLPNNPYNYNTSNSDLMLRIISKGYIDRNNGRYYEASSVSERNRIAMRIEIENIGRGETGPFIFTGNLSGYSSDQYTSPVQNTFYTGEKRQYTIDFNSNTPDIGTNKITIRLDTNNNVNETNETNNVLSEDVLVY